MAKKERTTVVLDEPVKRGDKEIPEVQVRKPQAGELRGLSLKDIIEMEATALHKLLPRITAPALTEAEVAELDPADLMQLGVEAASFFIPKATRATLTA